MKKLLKNKKGMTLIELITAMIVFSVFSMSVSAIFAPTLKSYRRANDIAETNALLDTISAQMLSELNEAKSIKIEDGDYGIPDLKIESGIRTINYQVRNDGYLYRNDSPLFDPGFYRGKTVGISYLDKDGSTPISAGPVPSSFIVQLWLVPETPNAAVFATRRDYAVSPIGLTKYVDD